MKRAYLLICLILCMILSGCSGSGTPSETKSTPKASSGISDDAPFLHAVRSDFSTDDEWTIYKTGCQAIENGDLDTAKTELNKIVGTQKGNESYIYALAREAENANKPGDARHYYNMIIGIRDADERHASLAQNDFTYTELSDGTLSITQYTGNDMYMRLPSQLNGKTVTEIAPNAFKGNRSFHIVYLPDTIRALGQSAFENCSYLKYINIPEGVTEIPERCFYKTDLYEISLPSTLTAIGNYGIYAGDTLCYVFVPEGVTTLGEDAIVGHTFGSCFTVVHLPSTITEISEKSLTAGVVYHAGSQAVQDAFPNSITGTKEDALNHEDPKINRASTVPSPLMSGVWKQLPTSFSRGGETLAVCIVDPKAPAGSVFMLGIEYQLVDGITVMSIECHPITVEGWELKLMYKGRGLKISSLEYSR